MEELELELEFDKDNNDIINNSNIETILVNKPNYTFKRLKQNLYQSIAILENKNCLVEQMMGFPFIKLMFDINNDKFDIVDLNIINDTEANLFVLMKPLFSHLGISQRFLSIKLMKHIVPNKGVNFIGIPYPELIRNYNIKNKNIIHAPIADLQIMLQLINPHKFQIIEFIKLDDNFYMSIVFEKIFIVLFKRIFINIINIFSTIAKK